MDWNLTYRKKNGKNYMKMVQVQRLSKLKLWTFFWGQGEHEWSLVKNSLLLIFVAQLRKTTLVNKCEQTNITIHVHVHIHVHVYVHVHVHIHM